MYAGRHQYRHHYKIPTDTDEDLKYFLPSSHTEIPLKASYGVDDGFFMSKRNSSLTRRSSLKEGFKKLRETIGEHLHFDKLLNKHMEVLDKFLENSKLLPVGFGRTPPTLSFRDTKCWFDYRLSRL
jgi:hypothetical protein